MSDPTTTTENAPPPPMRPGTFKFFGRFLTGHTAKLWAIGVMLVVGGSLGPIIGSFASFLGRNWNAANHRRVWVALGLLAVYFVVAMAANFTGTFLSVQVREEMAQRIRSAVFRKIGNFPAEAASQQSVGAMAQRVSGDVKQVADVVAPGGPQALYAFAQLVFVLVLVFPVAGWPFGVAAILMIPAVLIGTGAIHRRVHQSAMGMQASSERMLNQMMEGIGGYRDLAAAGRFGHAADRFDGTLSDLKKRSVSTIALGGASVLVPLALANAVVFVFYFAKFAGPGAVALRDNTTTAFIGTVTAGAALLMMVPGPIIGVTQYLASVAMAAPSFAKLRALLETPEAPEGGPASFTGRTAQRVASGEIVFEDVTFGHLAGAAPVLDKVSFRIPAGQFTAIIGQSGSGKTTLFHLLLRLLEPQFGRITIGGVPLREMPLGQLRDLVGFIPQSPFIFDASIRENLLMGLPPESVDGERVARAVRLAHLDEVVENRAAAGGLDAPAGSGGAALSGGERQRIALGRLFLRDPQVVVCDEYTANIDNATAKLIHEAMAREFAGKTRVVIAHQLYAVRGADQILVLDGGRVADQGRHEELIARPGLYRELWDVQRLD